MKYVNKYVQKHVYVYVSTAHFMILAPGIEAARMCVRRSRGPWVVVKGQERRCDDAWKIKA